MTTLPGSAETRKCIHMLQYYLIILSEFHYVKMSIPSSVLR